MPINAKTILRRYDDAEKDALLQELLDQMTPMDAEPLELVAFAEIYDEAKEIADKGSVFDGLSTGYDSLDQMTKGLGAGDLVVVYGYTSMGKSQLTQNIALNVAKADIPLLFIGLELTNKQNAARFIKMGGADPGLPFVFPTKPDIHYLEIQAAIKKAKEEAGIGLVVVDQLQDLIHDKVNEQGEIGQIMAELKRAAIINEVPIIVVSHVNRQGAQPGPPPLEVLKGSSSIEQKTDIALAVYQDHDAREGDKLYQRMLVKLTKNRQKGMEFRNADLQIQSNMRLIEPSINILTNVFPGATMVE